MGSVAGKRTRNVLVAVEVALSLVLLIGAGLMIKSFVRLQQTSLGFNPDQLLTVNVSLSSSKYPEDRQRAAFFQQALERIQSLAVFSLPVRPHRCLLLSLFPVPTSASKDVRSLRPAKR